MRKELSQDYASLCSQQNPVTEFLFGDIADQLKNIAETNKVGLKMKPQRHNMGHRFKHINIQRRKSFLYNRPSPWSLTVRNKGRASKPAIQAPNHVLN